MRPLRRRFTLAVTAVTVATVAACGSSTTGASSSVSPSGASGAARAASFPATVNANGTTVTIKQKPTAIVSLSATATEMLYAIGAGSQVKAVDQYSNYPPAAPKTKLSGLQTNVEALIAEKPDLVLVDADRNGLGKRLAALSIPVLVLPAATAIDDVYAQLDELGTATGHASEATKESADLKKNLADIVASVKKPSTPITYYYELEPDYYSVTSSTFVGKLLRLIGMRSIADKAADATSTGGYPQLSAEYIIKANPDVILLADTICCQASAATVAKRAGWSTITAVSKGEVIPLSDDIASRWGPRIVDLVKTVADAVKG